MTTPEERYRSIIYARQFLEALMDPRQTKKIPSEIRKSAFWRLEHFPSEFDLKLLREKCPEILGNVPPRAKG